MRVVWCNQSKKHRLKWNYESLLFSKAKHDKNLDQIMTVADGCVLLWDAFVHHIAEARQRREQSSGRMLMLPCNVCNSPAVRCV